MPGACLFCMKGRKTLSKTAGYWIW